MSGIVAVAQSGQSSIVSKGLRKLSHRGVNGPVLFDLEPSTQGQVWSNWGQIQSGMLTRRGVVLDGVIHNWRELHPGACSAHYALDCLYSSRGPEFVADLDGSFAIVMSGDKGIFAARDTLGISPLYMAECDGVLCFASEVKALLGWAENIREFPPGCYYESGSGIVCYSRVTAHDPANISEDEAATLLRKALADAVAKMTASNSNIGAWLSGGLDSSTMAVLARLQLPDLHTFAVGLPGAPDLEYARYVAAAIDAEHHELEVSKADILRTLPEMIYHLESFDALLIRSSVVNFMVGRLSAGYVPVVFSGEGGDELFAGYDYLKGLRMSELPHELVDITNRLHNTALQRVDRCSSAHGLRAIVAFLDREVVDLALKIPPEYKMRREDTAIEKWILRRAMYGLLPDAVLNRTKSKFWEGSGVQDLLHQHAEETISDGDFAEERRLPDGGVLNSKEELMYYRIFKDHFGELEDLSFVGRTKLLGAPVV